MPLVVQRIVASLAALAVFLISVNCACGGALEVVGRRQSTLMPMPCCAGGHGHHHRCSHKDRDHSRPCDKTCEHCQQALMNDTVGGYRPTAVSLPLWVPILDPLRMDIVASGNGCPLIFCDLPPPGARQTLVSLHCALTT